MRQEKRRWPVIAGVLLCLFTLALSIVVQENGYLTYLNSDMASEMILARRQADTGSLVQMDWLYSTEIHSIHMNLFYAFAFLFTPDFMWARIIGNTIGFVIAMASCVVLCRRLGLSLAKGLFTAALLPFAAGTLYASNVTVGGYYIIHMPFAFLGAALWLDASEGGMGRRKGLCAIAAFAALCMLEGLLSVRYVLCFVCPMVVVAALDVLLAPHVSHSLRDIRRMLDRQGLLPGDVDYYLLHQANMRILEGVRHRLNVGEERFPHDIEFTGNTSSCSIPLLMDIMKKDGRLVPGARLILSAFGAGLCTATAYIEWH